MGINIQVTDLEHTDKAALIKTAEFMLSFAGYSKPAAEPEAPAAPVRHAWPEDDEPKLEASQVFAQPQNLAPPGIDVDAKGLPWDSRIHSGSRAKNADGTWRQKRGLDPVVLERVEFELKQTMGAPAPAPVEAPAEVIDVPAVVVPEPVVPVPPPFVSNAAVPVPPAAIVPPAPTGPVGAAPTASPSNMTFPQLMQKITQAFTAKTLDQSMIQEACAKAGIPSLPMLASRPDKVAEVANNLGIA